jgi:cytidylate kinase
VTPVVIAIDGPVGAGKSTVAEAVSSRLGMARLSSGAMYRAVALAALRNGVDLDDGAALAALARGMSLEVNATVLLDGEDVTDAVREEPVSEASSVVARHPDVRAELVRRQQAWIERHQGGVVEGRDIGTVVAPDATLKVFLTAALDERARRRAEELASARSGDASEPLDPAEVGASLAERDQADITRPVSPLMAADDAVVLDTTGRSVEDVVDEVMSLLAERGGLPEQRGLAEGAGPTERGGGQHPGQAEETTSDERRENARPEGATPAAPPQAGQGAPLRPPRGLPGPMPPTPAVRAFYAGARLIMLGLFRALWDVQIEGAARVPSNGPYILAPVHRNNIDTVLAGLIRPRRPHYLAKASLWTYRPAGWLWSILGGFPVQRDSRDLEALRRCVRVLQSGEPLVVFPEGTRRSGPTVGPLEEGAAYLALRTGTPIVPVGIGGSENALPKGSALPRRVKIDLVVGEALEPEGAGARIPRHEMAKLTERLCLVLQELFDQAQARAAARSTRS